MHVSHPTTIAIIFRCLSMLACICLFACEEKKPTCLMPGLEVEEAQEITRNTALLTGKVETAGEGKVTLLRFRYGTSATMEQEAACDPSSLLPSAVIEGLQPNTTYHYCLEAGNGYSLVQSPASSFTTLPNRKPIVGIPEMLNQGPLSITLQYLLEDDGGEPVTSAGFYYCAAGGTEQQCLLLSATGGNFLSGSVLRGRISGLQAQTAYTVQAYATNSIGETRSSSFSFRTGEAIVTTQPGMLPEAVDENEKYLYSSLSIAGPLNGTDLRLIRDMLGRGIHGEETPGCISMLDLADATICAGGLSYDGMHYTIENTVSYGMFANSPYLQRLRLPDNTLEIERNAFSNCPALASLQIPASTLLVAPSDSCFRLAFIEVAPGNTAFHSREGVLYDQACTRLFWFPAGKEEIPLFPATLKSVEEYAFRNCRASRIDLPENITQIGQGAFHGASLEEMVLPDGVEVLATGVFQECRLLTSVTLGSRTGYLSNYCFDGCPLQHLYVEATEVPPMCQEQTFNEVLFKECTLHVPAGCRSLYRNSTYWGRFEKIVESERSSSSSLLR